MNTISVYHGGHILLFLFHPKLVFMGGKHASGQNFMITF